MKIKLILLSCLVAFNVQSKELKLNEKFIHAINGAEASGQQVAPPGDNGAAIGPFQIHFDYWADAATYDKSLGGTYECCTNYQYSCRVVGAYLNRYARRYIKANDFKNLARIHNGGPYGFRQQKTLQYWRKVQSWLDK